MKTNYINYRIPPSSSELIALSTLTPPSPILTSSFLSTSITSGEIPILLDDLEFSVNQRYSDSSLGSRRQSLRESIISQSDSYTSIGTFGPICRRQRSGNCSNYATTGVTSFTLAIDKTPTSDTSAFASQSGPPVYVPARTSPKLVIHRPRVDPPPIEYLSKDEVQDTVCSPTRERDTFNPLQDVPHKQRTTALGMKAPRPESLVQNNDGRETYTKVCSGGSARPAKISMESAHHERDHHNLNCIQNTPNWLLDIEVMVSIDQEGFRSVIPAFKFIGISPRILEGGNPASRDLARFLPATRQVFQFHYAPFDGLPILRRITLSNDETRDYISRQATLTLKSNGIYTVHGIELATQGMIKEAQHHQNASEIYWEFVYRIDDRRVGPSRRIMDGEKNLTPLSFSCSPALLHPRQGKRIKLMHIVKKSVTAKLTAEKLTSCHDNTLAKRNVLQDITNKEGYGLAPNWHRRAVSHERHHEITANSRKLLQPRDIQQENTSQSNDTVLAARRRRASSAGEWKRLELERHLPAKKASLQRHIIPPARLVEMFGG